MKYLREQEAKLKAAIASGETVEDRLSLKAYVHKIIAEKISNFCPSGGRVLEVGCGSSFVIHYLNEMGFDVVGVDIDEETVRYAKFIRDQFCSDAEISLGDARTLHFTENTFDYVFSSGLIEHFPIADQMDLINEMNRVSNGYVHLDIPNPHPLGGFFRLSGESDETHYDCHPSILLNQAGLTIIEIDGVGLFDRLSKLSENPPLYDYLFDTHSSILKERYFKEDIAKLIHAERQIPYARRLLHAFHLSWIGSIDTEGRNE